MYHMRPREKDVEISVTSNISDCFFGGIHPSRRCVIYFKRSKFAYFSFLIKDTFIDVLLRMGEATKCYQIQLNYCFTISIVILQVLKACDEKPWSPCQLRDLLRFQKARDNRKKSLNMPTWWKKRDVCADCYRNVKIYPFVCKQFCQ